MLQAAAVLDRDRYCEGREAVQEIRRAVERIDDPHVLAVAGAAALLGEERVIGMAAANGRDDLGLGLAVDVGDEVVAALGIDLERIETREAAHDEIAGAARGAHADVEKWLHRR